MTGGGEREPRFGAVALVGRPNAGKSTLLNRLLGEKLAIVSDKPQTTRHRLIGILSEERGQMVLWDTPGIHKPMHRLNREMVRVALASLAEADVGCLLIDAAEPFGKGDALVLERFNERASGVRILVLNKIDRIAKPKLLPRIDDYARRAAFDDIVPVSASTGDGCDLLRELLWSKLPPGEPLYDPELLTVHPERFLVAERIREKVLALVHEELPHATAVRIDAWQEDGELVRIYASLVAEKPGQKAILIGAGGSMIKAIGTAARLDLESFLERKVFLDLKVREEAGWRDDDGALRRLEPDSVLGEG